jgi:hypothetical protein
MTKKILVIEDNKKHIADAKEFFKEVQDWDITYATNYEEASEIMFEDRNKFERRKGNLDGIISDIYFPLNSMQKFNHSEDPIGVRVKIESEKLGIPCVLNTAGYHHGAKYEWIASLAYFQKWKIIDVEPIDPSKEDEEDYKNWRDAYEELKYKIDDSRAKN